jgi:hypothetical protein
MTEATQIKAVCIACDKEKLCQASLPLKRDNGSWQAQPLCPGCRRALITEAKAEGKFIRLFPLEASLHEAKKRNGNLATSLRPLLEKYGRAREENSPRESKA